MVPWEQATVHVSAMGASGGVSVFEGINGYWQPEQRRMHIFRLDRHLWRLNNSMKIMRMGGALSIPDWSRAVVELVQRNRCATDTYIRPVSYYSGAEHETFAQTIADTADLLIWTRTFPSRLGAGKTLRVCCASWVRIEDNQMPPRVKCMSNYQNNRLAMMEARANGYDLSVLLDRNGKLTEGPGAALFIVREGTVYTPPVTAGILESITREACIELLRDVLHVPVVERTIDRTELYVADEMFQCGTAAEVQGIVEVDRYPVGNGQVGPVTRELEALYHNIVRGRDDRYEQWRTTVAVG